MKNNNTSKKISTYLRPFRLKIVLERFINLFFLYSFIALIFVFLILAATKFIDFGRYKIWINNSAITVGVLFIIHFIYSLPRRIETIKIADNLSFSQRLVTAIELDGEKTEVAIAQRQNTFDKLNEIDCRKIYKISIRKKLLLPILLLSLLIIGSTYIDTKMANENRMASYDLEEIKMMSKNLDKEIELALEKANLDKKAIEDILDKMQVELKKAENKEEALKELSIAKNELRERLEKLQNSQSDSLNESEKKESEELAKAVETALKEIDETGRNLAGESISDFAFQNINVDVQNRASNQGNQNQSQQGQSQQGQNANQGKQNQGQNAQNAGQTSQNQSQQGQSGENSGEGNQSQSQQGQNSSEGSQSQSQEGEGSQENQQGQANAQGNPSQQGNVENSGQQGTMSQAGSESSDADMGYQEENSMAISKDSSEYKQKIYESIYDPERLGGKSNPTYLNGKKSNDSEKSYRRAQSKPSEAGEFIDYRDLYTEYSENAVYQADSMEIPSGMKTLVKGYFESLNE